MDNQKPNFILLKFMKTNSFLLFFVLLSITIFSCTKQHGSIEGVITNTETGIFLENVVVTITPENYNTLTDASGSFNFADLPKGIYTLTAIIEGYETKIADFDVVPDETTTANFSLSPYLEKVLTVTIGEISNITQKNAVATGNITDLGEETILSYGHCWATTSMPTINDYLSYLGMNPDTGVYTSNITGLQAETDYYIRAYAGTATDTIYSEQITFTTPQEIDAPTITTNVPVNITANSADCSGNVTSDGGGTIIHRGICWSTTSYDFFNATYKNAETNELGSFTLSATGLLPNTTYYINTFVTNEIVTSYGQEFSFTTTN